MHLRPVAAFAAVALAAGIAGYRALVHVPASPASPGAEASPPALAAASEAWSALSPAPAGRSGSGRAGDDPAARPVPARIVVYVAGEVVRAGVYRLPSGARAGDALRAAGGASTAADLVAVDLAAPLADGQEIAVPARGSSAAETADAAAAASSGDPSAETSPAPHRTHKRRHRKHRRRRHAETSASESGAAGSSAPETTPGTDAGAADAGVANGDAANAVSQTVDVNAASAEELEALPGIGPALAQRIVAYRDLNGPFASADELLDVAGMTPGKLDALADLLTFR